MRYTLLVTSALFLIIEEHADQISKILLLTNRASSLSTTLYGQAYRSAEASYCSVHQKLLGHASIKTTKDRYVRITDDSTNLAVQQFDRPFASNGVKTITLNKKNIGNKGE